MANKEKQERIKAKLKKMGPIPNRPKDIEPNDWVRMTEAAKRTLGKDCITLWIPVQAQWTVNGKRMEGRTIMTAEEAQSVRSTLSYRSDHDMTVIAGRKEKVIDLGVFG